MEISDENVKISVFIKDKGNLLANATVSLETVAYGFVTIKDFQIWRSKNLNSRLQEYINIKPLQRNIWGRWIDRVFFEDTEKWYELEAEIYNKYFVALSNANANQE